VRPQDLRDLVRPVPVGFWAGLTLSCAGLYALLHFLPSGFVAPINEHTASTLGLALRALGASVSTARDTVSEGGLAFEIISECAPIFTAGLFLSFVIFYPSTRREKATGLRMGLPLLYLGNMARLTTTFMISRYDRRLFEVVHVYLGQVFTIFLVMFAVIAWLRWLDHDESHRSARMKAAVFLGRFALISGCFFLVWLKMNHWYIMFVNQFMILGSSLFDLRLIIPRSITVYYETFNIVTFTSLVLGTPSIPWPRRLKGLGFGLAVFFLFYLVHRIDNLLITGFAVPLAVPVDYVVCAIGQYVLPVLMWLAIVRKFPRLK